MTTPPTYRDQLLREVNALPDEYVPYLLQLVQTFRESVTLKPAGESFAQGWHEAKHHVVAPLATLWEGIDVA